MTPRNRTGLGLAAIAATMAALSFAAVPFYDWFCRTTGYGGTVSVAETASSEVLDQTIIIRFDASLEAGMPWQFTPDQHEMVVKIGQNALASYTVHNPTDRRIAGTASFNVAPDLAGGYFTKIECFCFTEQILEPGESATLPVSFYVDPSIMDDPEASGIKEITLSYTFHETPLPEVQAALAPAAVKPVN